jgi:hypothetical protein
MHIGGSLQINGFRRLQLECVRRVSSKGFGELLIVNAGRMCQVTTVN